MRTPLEQINEETINLTKQVFAKGTGSGEMSKAVTTAMGLQGYNLEAPAKRLYVALSPLRNRIPRAKAPVGSLAAHWKAITGINTANVKAAVAFGTRNATTISYTTAERDAAYKSFGLDDSVEDESIWLSRGFDDVRALSALATLQSVMVEEEKLLIGGLSTSAAFALGTCPTPTVSNVALGGAGWAANVYVKCMALPLYGYLNSTLADLTAATGRIADHSAISLTGSVATGAATDTIHAEVTPVNGAVAYAWFVGSGAAEPAHLDLAAITTMPHARFLAAPNAANIPSSSAGFDTDTSGDVNAFDGLVPQIAPRTNTLTTLASYTGGTLNMCTGDAGGAYVTKALIYDMAHGVDYQGTALTSDGAGGIVEFDIVLKALWDYARIGPTLILVNSQEALRITQKIGGSGNLAYRIQLTDGDKTVVGGIYVSGYLNKFTGTLTPGSPDVIPIMMHPFLPPGQVIFLSERIPYPNNNVPAVLEMELQSEYADYEWARTQRKYEHGVYANGVLKHYFPAGCALIRGVKDA